MSWSVCMPGGVASYTSYVNIAMYPAVPWATLMLPTTTSVHICFISASIVTIGFQLISPAFIFSALRSILTTISRWKSVKLQIGLCDYPHKKWLPLAHAMKSKVLSCKLKALVNLPPTWFSSIISSFIPSLTSCALIPDNHLDSMLSCCHPSSHAVLITCAHIQTLLIFGGSTQWRYLLN